MSQDKNTLRYVSEIPSLIIKLGLGVLILLLVVVVWKGLHPSGFVFQPVQVPKIYEERGLTGSVLSNRIMDRVNEIKGKNASSVDSLSFTVDQNNDLNLELMGVGLSTATITFHMREVFGIETQFIEGDLVDLDNQLSLTLRLTGYPKQIFAKTYIDGSSKAALDEIINEAAIYVVRQVEPYRLALHYIRKYDNEKAKEIIREILNTRPSEKKWAYYLWGYICSMEDDDLRAREFYYLALKADSQLKEARRLLGWLDYQQNNYEAAIDQFLEYEKLDPNNFGVTQGIALSNWRLGKADEAEKHFQKNITNHKDNVWSYLNFTRFLLGTRKDTIGAIKLLQKASEELAESSEYFVSLSSIYFIQGKMDSAIILAERALEYNPENVTALSRLANHVMNVNKDVETGKQLYRNLVRASEKNNYESGMIQNSLNRLAMAEHQTGELDSARIHINKAIKIAPKNPYPWTTLAEIEAIEGNEDLFFKHLEKAVDLGFDVSNVVNDDIYKDFNRHPRFLALLKKDDHLD